MIFPDRYTPTGHSLQGGMGDIIQCVDKHLNRNVIFKLLKNGEDKRRLLDEQKALMKVRSKHVVQLYDVVKVQTLGEEKTALVLEHIDGSELASGSFSPNEVFLKTVWQIACGLDEIHKAKIIHRDIKPNNILIDADNVVKILDFGLSRQQGLEAKTVSVIGTQGFMAPELWSAGSTIGFSQAVDVYAFGITAIALISQNLPFELLNRPPTPVNSTSVASILDGVPTDIIEVLIQCLNQDSSVRPAMSSVEEIFRRHLLQGRHRALLVMNQKTHEINSVSPAANITCGTLGSIQIRYNGTSFLVAKITGNVSVNNKLVVVGHALPACCVVTFGSATNRRFMTFDVSNPEVTA